MSDSPFNAKVAVLHIQSTQEQYHTAQTITDVRGQSKMCRLTLPLRVHFM